MPAAAKKNLVRAILLTGLLAGTLDITCAFINYFISTGRNPVTIFPYISRGMFGPAALEGGVSMIIWGVFFHYLIAMLFTAFFFFIYPRIPFLRKNIVLTGLLYGIFTWMVMNLMVVPLSAIGRFPSSVSRSLIECSILMFAIGLPVSIMAYRFYLRK